MMNNLLGSQMDFLLFFYGASFVLLGVVCLAILKRETASRALPWLWLGFFGFTHGASEWMDMVAFSLGDSFLFKTVRLFTLLLSYVFLMEFARRGSFSVWGRRISPYFYFALAVLAFSGAWFGWPGIDATGRYFFGFTSAAWTAVILFHFQGYEEVPLSKLSRFLLYLSAMVFLAYSVFGGLIVSPANFFPASIFNAESFIKIVHLPVQLFRGIFAFIVALVILFYAIKNGFEVFIKKDAARERRFFISAATVILFIFLFFLVAWGVTDFYGRYIVQTEQEVRYLRAKAFGQLIDLTVARMKGIEVLTGAPAIAEALTMPVIAEPVLADINERLDRYKEVLGADVCYLMNAQGVVLASSNREDADSFVGKDYSFRPYFQQAMQGEGFVYLASGVTSLQRGLYVSAPVFSKKGGLGADNVVGVAVAKAGVGVLEEYFRPYPYLFLVSPQDVIFLSSKQDWLFRALRNIPVEEKKILKESRQFGDGPWDNVGFEKKDDVSGTVYLEDRMLYFASEPVENFPGWKIIFMDNKSRVASARFILIVVFLSFFVFVAVVSVLIFRLLLDALRLEASESLYEALVEGSPDAVNLFNHEGICLSANKNGLAMLGLKKEDVLGRCFQDLWPMEDRRKMKEFMADALEGKKRNFEVKRLRADGALVISAVMLSPIFEQKGAIKYFMAIARDVTEERRSRERLLQSSKMATVGSLATGVSHEFNNVLEIILGNAELAAASNDLDVMKKSLKIIVDSARRAAWIIKTMLDFSGKASEAREFVDIAELIKQNLVLLNKVFEVNNVTVETRFNEVPRVYCNPGQLSQAFVNIMMNARDAMWGLPHKKLTITVDYRLETSDVLVSFEDTGTGVKEEVKHKLFGPFVTTKGILGGGLDKQPGVGLGLFLAYGIVKQHNGNITFESELGRGTKFIVSLPIFVEGQ